MKATRWYYADGTKRAPTQAIVNAAKLNGRLGGKEPRPRSVDLVFLGDNEWAARIPLTKGLSAIVDIDVLDKVAGRRWCANAYGYAVCGTKTNGKHRVLYMHRVIAGTGDAFETDHRNLNKLDNRLCNLRQCTRSQNERNKPARKTSRSGIKGASFNKNEGKFVAAIKIGDTVQHLGYFDTAEKAGKAYEEQARKLHGEFFRV